VNSPLIDYSLTIDTIYTPFFKKKCVGFSHSKEAVQERVGIMYTLFYYFREIRCHLVSERLQRGYISCAMKCT
jgi:hypothetical protein